MRTISIIAYAAEDSGIAGVEFEEIEQQTVMSYSMSQLIEDGIGERGKFIEAFHKALEVCSYAGINPAEHFRQVYAYDTGSGMMDTDWLISERGLRLIAMQYRP